MTFFTDEVIRMDGFCPKCGSSLKGKMISKGRMRVYCSNIFCNFSYTLEINSVDEETDRGQAEENKRS